LFSAGFLGEWLYLSKIFIPTGEKNGNRQGAIFCELRHTFLNNCEFVTDILTKREKKQRFLSLLHCTNFYCYRFLSDISQLMSFFNGVDLMGYTFLFACQVMFGIYFAILCMNNKKYLSGKTFSM